MPIIFGEIAGVLIVLFFGVYLLVSGLNTTTRKAVARQELETLKNHVARLQRQVDILSLYCKGSHELLPISEEYQEQIKQLTVDLEKDFPNHARKI